MEERGNRPRILMIDTEVTWRGGEAQLGLLMRGLPRDRFTIVLASPPGSAISSWAREFGVPSLALSVAGGADLRAAWRLRGYLEEGRFDLVHCHTSHAHGIAFLALRLMRPGRGSRPALVVSRRVDFPVAKNGLSALKYRYGADVYVAISRGVEEVLLQGGIEKERIALVPSGIDLGKFDTIGENHYLREEFDIADGTTVIGNVAALAPHKSQVDFIRAARIVAERVDRAKFFIVGEGHLRPALENLIDEVGMRGRIIMTGFRKDVLAIMSLFDCFVLSSYLEGLCTSVMDAQVMGIPVVATNTGGVPDLIENEVTGLLVPPRRPDQLADAVVRMVGDSALRSACVEAAGSKAESYDYRRMVAGTIKVYDNMLSASVTSR